MCSTPLDRRGSVVWDGGDAEWAFAEAWPPTWPPAHPSAWPAHVAPPHPIYGPYGHRLTWSDVFHAHSELVAHAHCAARADAYHLWHQRRAAAASFDSDDEDSPEPPPPCHCTWHPAAEDDLEHARATCGQWPGPVCGVCWSSCCSRCHYVFDDPRDAAGRDVDARLLCAACAPEDA